MKEMKEMKTINLTATKNMRNVLRDNGKSQDGVNNSKNVKIIGRSHQHKVFQKYGSYDKEDKMLNELPDWVFNKSYQFEIIDSIHQDISNTEWQALFSRCLSMKQSEWIVSELEKKLEGYKRQDERKNRKYKYPVQLRDLCEMFQKEEYRCHYCRELLSVIHRETRCPSQWSLDRMDNDKPHDIDNLVLSCYACNIRRRTRSYNKFKESFSVENFNKLE